MKKSDINKKTTWKISLTISLTGLSLIYLPTLYMSRYVAGGGLERLPLVIPLYAFWIVGAITFMVGIVGGIIALRTVSKKTNYIVLVVLVVALFIVWSRLLPKL